MIPADPPDWFLQALEENSRVMADGGWPDRIPGGPPSVLDMDREYPEFGVLPDYRFEDLTLGEVAGGSNGARWATDPDGRKWIVKSYGGNADRVATELVANRIYGVMRAPVPMAGRFKVGGQPALAYLALDGEVRPRCFQSGQLPPSEALGQHYMVDALLANWDFVGLDDDNILWDAGGNPMRIDQGGTLEFRAMGERKQFGPSPDEVITLLSEGQAKRAVRVTPEQMREQAALIRERITEELIDELIAAAPFNDLEMAERLRNVIPARVRNLERLVAA